MASPQYTALVDQLNANRQTLQVQYDLLRGLTAQRGENQAVKTEFGILEADGVIWKLVGPVMIRQDREEAMANVEKRIEFIDGEIYKAEEAIKVLEQEFETKRAELMKLQGESQPEVRA